MRLIRKIEEKDAETILRIRAAAVEQSQLSAVLYDPEILAAWTSVVSPETIEKERCRIHDGGYVGFGAEVEGQLVCFGRLDIAQKNLMQLYCRPDFQHQGHAFAVLSELEKEAVKAGVDVLELSASLLGKPFYIKAGYVCARNYDFILPGDIKMPCVMMNKQL